ncbi:hypothetical protein N7476_001817 [Penicillium atrosanguineum]|uniref:Zn(2)-C6 fungal-type domain-containing protein n=1 Tax=Penicillium atrosanguineum TaxID=1132637 RepID=A0A9W9Q4J4_9EURO|nr:hypothetical protein N7476_001817 [Penicillium atrosanguineum]
MQRSMRRYKTVVACTTCRRRKLKCDGVRPVCTRCQTSSVLRATCTYVPVSATAPGLKSPISPTSASTPGDIDQRHIKDDDVDDDHFSDGDPSEFSFQVKTTIDTKLGLPPRKQRCPIPMTDAAMFACLPCGQPFIAEIASVENVLPLRRQADQLVNLYWDRLDVLDPLLDKEGFFRCYNALFRGIKLPCDERIFTSTLNAIFALATQVQEAVHFRARDTASKKYFLRAWSLLGPETSIWNSSSLELVQCLLLMARYLQCTNSLHHTWMAVGSALRISQSLGLHIPERNVSPSNGQSRLKREVWSQCVFLDSIHHTRILLFRPMLARFCLSQSNLDSSIVSTSSPANLSDRVLESCAAICIESASRLISIVSESWQGSVNYPAGSIDPPLLPWWFRIFYLHVASQHLIAAMLRADLFASLVTESWSSAMTALRAHEHISPSVQRCIAAFERMWSKVMKIQTGLSDGTIGQELQSATLGIGPETDHIDVDEFMQDILRGFESNVESPLFALDDVNWFESLDQ